MQPRDPGRRVGTRDYRWADRRAVNRNASRKKIAALTLTLVALLGGGAGLYVVSKRSYVATDSETLCPKDRPVAELAVVILDVSDQLTDLQILAIKNDFKRVQRTIPRFGRVEVYTLQEASSAQPRSFIQVCNPGSGEDLNSLYQNPELARGRWETSFDARLSDEIERLLRTDSDDQSPIYEAIQATVIRTLQRPEFDSVPKRLIVFSDLLQNVRGKQSHYQSVPDLESFKSATYFEQIRTDMSGVDVEIYYIRRATVQTQGGKHMEFWTRYLSDQGAIVRSAKSIEGDR